MQTLEELFRQFPADLYDVENPQTSIHALFTSLLTVLQSAEATILQTSINNNLSTARGRALDDVWGLLFEIPRESDETYSYAETFPFLTEEQKIDVVIKDNRYRNRLIRFVEAINEGPIISSIKKVVEAASGFDCVILENYEYGEGEKDETGKYEFTVKLVVDCDFEKTKLSMSDEEYSLFFRERSEKIQGLINKIKPSSSVYVITSEGISQDVEIIPESVEAESEHYKEIYGQNYVEKIKAFSSELPREIENPNSINGISVNGTYTATYEIPIQYNATGNVPSYFRGTESEDVWGHWPGQAFDNNSESYWLSTSDDGPDEVYSYEYVQGYTAGQFFNQIRFQLRVPSNYGRDMLCFVSLHDGNGWVGGGIIPYQGYVAYIYPSGAQWDCGAGIPYYTALYAQSHEGWQTIDIPAGNWHYVRLTFTHLHYWADEYPSTYSFRAGMRELKCFNSNYQSHPSSYSIDGNSDTAWWSSNGSSASLTMNFNGYKNITRLKVKTDSSGINYSIAPTGGIQSVASGSLRPSDSQINFQACYANSITISFSNLPVYQEGQMFRLYEISAHETYFVYDYPATNTVNRNKSDYWISRSNVSGKNDTEWIEYYLSPDGSVSRDINRISVYSPYQGYLVTAFVQSSDGWKMVGQKQTMPKEYIFEFETETTNAIKVQIQNLTTLVHTQFGANDINGCIASLNEVLAWEYEREYLWGPENTIDNNDFTFWLSGKRTMLNDETYLIYTLPVDSAITKIFLNPVTYGIDCQVYFSQDGENWAKYYHEYYLTKQNIQFTKRQIRYIKLVFSNLQKQSVAGYCEIVDSFVKTMSDEDINFYHAGIKTVSFFTNRFMNVDVDQINESFSSSECVEPGSNHDVAFDSLNQKVYLDNNSASGSLETVLYNMEHPVRSISLEMNSGIDSQMIVNSDFAQSTPIEVVRGWEISNYNKVEIDDGAPEKLIEMTTTEDFLDFYEE